VHLHKIPIRDSPAGSVSNFFSTFESGTICIRYELDQIRCSQTRACGWANSDPPSRAFRPRQMGVSRLKRFHNAFHQRQDFTVHGLLH
jgi:hypothetical protein